MDCHSFVIRHSSFVINQWLTSINFFSSSSGRVRPTCISERGNRQKYARTAISCPPGTSRFHGRKPPKCSAKFAARRIGKFSRNAAISTLLTRWMRTIDSAPTASSSQTGSGKTTTQAALIDFINQNFSKHVVTIEEPIEFVHDSKRSIITQREVPGDSISFAAGLKASLREDTDIVLIGEMRDLETISLALTAAETGLLVIGTLHTNNARKTVDRMIDAFPADRQAQAQTMLANSLRAVVAQLLLKRSDRPGRIAVNEILIANAAVAAIIREGATQKLQDVIVSGKAQGMQFMDDTIWALLEKGIVSAHEAFMKAIDKNRFKPFLSAEEEALANAAGSVPDDEKRIPGNFVKQVTGRARAGTR